MPDSILELLVVSYFGSDVASIREQLEGEPWRVRHTRDLASLKVELARARPHVVIVDRWLLRDEAPDCLNLARAVHHVPGLLMVAESELLGGSFDFSEPVDGVLEKPLRKQQLLDRLRQLAGLGAGERAVAADPAPPTTTESPPAPSPEPVPEPVPEPELMRDPTPEPVPDPMPAAAASTPASTGNGSGLERTLGAARLLDEVRETLRRLGDVIRVDSISGLLFRDFFLDRAQRETRRAARYGEPLAAMMIDIDDFKAVNDQHGHDAGNEVLSALGGIVAGSIRRDLDFACRLHGDEFAILLPSTALEGARTLGERLVERVREHADGVRFSVSVGVHALGGEELGEDGLGRLLEGADQALLQAKRAGKGRIHPAAPAELPFERADVTAGAPPAFDDAEPDLGVDVPPPPIPMSAAFPGAPVSTTSPGLPADAKPTERGLLDSGDEFEDDAEGDAVAAAGKDSVDPSNGAPEDAGVPPAAAPGNQDDFLAAALAEAAAALAREDDLRDADDFRGKALLVSAEPEVAEILAGFLRKRGLPVEVAGDLASALTLLDSLEFFLVMADAAPGSAEARAFSDAVRRIDPALQVFLFVGEGEVQPDEPETAELCYVRKPFLLSELYLRASRAREDYHLRQARD